MTVKFARGTPRAVCELIETFLAIPDLPPRQRAAIERLAAREEMEALWKTGVPPKLRGREAKIIGETIPAYGLAISLQPPIETRLKEFKEYWKLHPKPITDPAELAAYKERFTLTPLSYGGIATSARVLLENLNEIPSFTRSRWPEIWSGDPAMTFDKLVSTIEAVAACCDRLDTEARKVHAMLNLPKPPRKPGATSAPQVYFDRLMKDFFRRTCGRPHIEIVATLEQVVFDLPESADESTVRKR